MAKRNIFNSVKLVKPNRNAFDLSHDVKFSCNMAELIPVMCLECVPGDKIKIGNQSLTRFAPMVAPVMHRFDYRCEYFFVPNRILWENWENFITNTKVGGVVPAFPYVTIAADGSDYTRLMDYLGIPKPTDLGATGSENVSAMPFAAYQKIYNDYYRDENLVDEVTVWDLVDGLNGDPDLVALRKRAWEHDYFTSALPFAQKGQPVEIPLGLNSDVPVRYNADHDTLLSGTPDDVNVDSGTPVQQPGSPVIPPGGLYADTSELVSEFTTINDLRRAIALQEWLERNALGGTRYTENIYAHFGVQSSDKRLQRPEYIVGCKSPVIVSEVLNTTGTDSLPQGNMAGHGVSVAGGNYGSYFCEEHGYIIGIVSVMPKTAYQQGLPKHFLKITDFTQYFWPKFAHIGEQPIEKRELYAFQGDAGKQTFGYVPRYAEYRFENSRVAGDFRGNLNYWHDGRIFESAGDAVLNGDFVTASPDPRIFAVTDPDVQKLYMHVLNQVLAIRPMPKFGTPAI